MKLKSGSGAGRGGKRRGGGALEKPWDPPGYGNPLGWLTSAQSLRLQAEVPAVATPAQASVMSVSQVLSD